MRTLTTPSAILPSSAAPLPRAHPHRGSASAAQSVGQSAQLQGPGDALRSSTGRRAKALQLHRSTHWRPGRRRSKCIYEPEPPKRSCFAPTARRHSTWNECERALRPFVSLPRLPGQPGSRRRRCSASSAKPRQRLSVPYYGPLAPAQAPANRQVLVFGAPRRLWRRVLVSGFSRIVD
jgi:hypothetical protein